MKPIIDSTTKQPRTLEATNNGLKVDFALRPGENTTYDLRYVARSGPNRIKQFTPPETGFNDTSVNGETTGPWLDVAGYSKITVYVRFSTAPTNGTIRVEASPVGSNTTWGTDNDWATSIAYRSSLSTQNNVLGTWGTSTSDTNFMAPTCSKIRLKINGGAAITARAWVLCEP